MHSKLTLVLSTAEPALNLLLLVRQSLFHLRRFAIDDSPICQPLQLHLNLDKAEGQASMCTRKSQITTASIAG